MEPQREILRCHACHGIQRDRRMYLDPLLRIHGEVSRRRSNIPVRLEERELAIVRASVHRRQVSCPVRATRCRAELGLPEVSDREAERRLRDNCMRTARSHCAAAQARGEAAATLGAPEVQERQEVTNTGPVERIATRTRSSRSKLKVEEHVIFFHGGGTRRPQSPCERCTNCECRCSRDYSSAPEPLPLLNHRPPFSHTRQYSTIQSPSLGRPQVWREQAQPDEMFNESVKDDEGRQH